MIKSGSVVPMKSFRMVVQDGKGWVEFKADKGKQFAFLLMGVEDIEGDKIDPDDFLKSMGWEFKDD